MKKTRKHWGRAPKTKPRRHRVALLIGAGASAGAGAITPYPPPLGGELYGALCAAYPNSWGSLPRDVAEPFGKDFELGMDHLWNAQLNNGSTLIIEMAVYFSQFDPPTDKSDCYSTVLRALRASDLIARTAVASLNYECIFEIAASKLGLKVAYAAKHPPAGNVLVLKPHGSCNFLPRAEVWNLSIVAKNIFEGPIDPYDLPQLRDRYRRGFALPPAMSLFAPGKPTPVATTFVRHIRDLWADWVRSSSAIVIIGARPFMPDEHVWQPITASPAPIWFVGGTGATGFDDFTGVVGSRITDLGERFADSVDSLVDLLRVLGRDHR